MLHKTRRPFKGPTPEGIFQTVDIGTGPSNAWISEQAHKSPSRRYAAVDPAFKSYAQTKLALERFGVLAEPTTLSEFLQKMIANNWKTRHFVSV